MKVSVIIPCLNSEEWLGATLRSVANQTVAPAEVLVVDNGSTDGSVALAERFAPMVRVLTASERGAARARLTGAAEATGEALMFLDADDLIGPEVLEGLTAVLAEHPDVVALCHWVRYELAGRAWVAGRPSNAPRRVGDDDLSAWLAGWWHPPCALLWSRAAYQRSGGWDPAWCPDDDGDVMMRGLVRGNRLVGSACGTAYYRRLPGGEVSLSERRRERAGVESRLRVYDRLADMLRADGRLRHYAVPLAGAYLNLAADSTAHDDLAALCRERAGALDPQGRAARRTRTLSRGWQAARRRLQTGGPAVHPGTGATPAAAGSGTDADAPTKVSVIIPTYNRAALLGRAISSVLAQTHEDFELIVVDDASTDDTGERVAAMRDPRIRYLRQEENRGVAAARNRGIGAARGDLLAFLDSDDEWLPEALAAHVRLFRTAPARLGLARAAVLEVSDEEGERVIRLPGQGLLFRDMLRQNLFHAGGSNAVMRRAAVELVGLFDESLPAVEDWEYFLRISRFYELGYIDQVLVRYRDVRRDSARRSRNLAANLTAREMLARRYANDLKRLGLTQEFRLGTARRHLVPPYASWRGAAGQVLAAIRARPLSAAPLRLMPLLLTPRWARAAYRRLRPRPAGSAKP